MFGTEGARVGLDGAGQLLQSVFVLWREGFTFELAVLETIEAFLIDRLKRLVTWVLLIKRLPKEHQVLQVLDDACIVRGKLIAIFFSSDQAFNLRLLARCQIRHSWMLLVQGDTVSDSIHQVFEFLILGRPKRIRVLLLFV